jgi:glycosyltransferase involved in cell wall biosynthesis
MNLCFIIYDITARGGTERAQANLANALSMHGQSISIWSLYQQRDSTGFQLSSDVKVSYGRRRPLPYFLDYPWLMCMFAIYVIWNRPSWIVCTDTNRLIIALLAVFVPGVRLAVWEHYALSHSITKRRGRIARQLAAALAARIVTLTERDKELYCELYAPAGKVMTVPNIVSCPVNSLQTRKKEVIAVGRLNHQKGFDLLLDAWSIAARRVPDWNLRIVGDGEMRDQLLRQAHTLGIERRTTFAPYAENPFPLYSECGIFVLSSRFEGLPFVLIEAMMCGAPCVSFDCPNGPRELIGHGINGLLVPAEDVSALGETIVALAEKPACRLRIGVAAQGIADRFSEDRIVAMWQKQVLCD